MAYGITPALGISVCSHSLHFCHGNLPGSRGIESPNNVLELCGSMIVLEKS